ncbi:MAG: ice-binding family protein [Sphaerochaeta sp.]|nr:ice-binding family protein [Sphaerochaeta sp.]
MKKTKNQTRNVLSIFAIILIAVALIGCEAGITSTGEGTGAIDLGSAANYVILSKTGVSTVPNSVITGDVGLSPAATSYLTGFGLTLAGTYATSTQVVGGGKLYAATMTSPTPSILTTAIADMQTAYTFAAGRTLPDKLNFLSGAIGGQTLTSGLYKWTSSVNISGSNLIISGSATDTWIFQIDGDLTLAAAKSVTLSGGALAKNIVWQVAGTVTLGSTSHFEGVVLCKTNIDMQTNASMNGRLLAQTSIALDQATVTKPAL